MPSTKIIYYMLGFVMMLFASMSAANACQCKSLTKLRKVELLKAEAVFIGRDIFVDSTDNWNRVIVFEVIDNLKKDGRKRISVVTGAGRGDCGLPVRAGQHWYIFTQNIKGRNVSICGRSMLLDDSLASISNAYGHSDYVLDKYSNNVRRVVEEIKYIRRKYSTSVF